MAESTLSVSYDELRRRIGRLIGSGVLVSEFDEADDSDINDILIQGLRMAYCPPVLQGEKYPHDWSFLTPIASLTTRAPYSIGTIGIAAGVVTLSGGSWPSYAADGQIEIAGVSHAISARDSDTQLTLVDSSATAPVGTRYSLAFPSYDLPDGFCDLIGPFTFRPGTAGEVGGGVQLVSEHQLRQRRQASEWIGRPRLVAVRPKEHATVTVGQRFEAVFYPTPDAAYELEYRIRIAPDNLTMSGQYPPGGMQHSQMIVEACLAAAEQTVFNDATGPHGMLFLMALAASVGRDRKLNSPDRLGPDDGGLEWYQDGSLSRRSCNGHVVTYNGVAY